MGKQCELMIINVHEGRLEVSGCSKVIENLELGVRPLRSSTYLLDISEVAYLIFKGLAKVKDLEGYLDLNKLFTKYSRSKYDWVKFTVLLDLRERGRKVRAAFMDNVLILDRGNRKVMIFVTEENSPIEASKLYEWASLALSKGYEPVLAVVDAHGDVTYYSLLLVRVEELGGVMSA